MRRATRTTVAPSAASSCAVDSPMPLEAPVINATVPLSLEVEDTPRPYPPFGPERDLPKVNIPDVPVAESRPTGGNPDDGEEGQTLRRPFRFMDLSAASSMAVRSLGPPTTMSPRGVIGH